MTSSFKNSFNNLFSYSIIQILKASPFLSLILWNLSLYSILILFLNFNFIFIPFLFVFFTFLSLFINFIIFFLFSYFSGFLFCFAFMVYFTIISSFSVFFKLETSFETIFFFFRVAVFSFSFSFFCLLFFVNFVPFWNIVKKNCWTFKLVVKFVLVFVFFFQCSLTTTRKCGTTIASIGEWYERETTIIAFTTDLFFFNYISHQYFLLLLHFFSFTPSLLP